LIVPLLYKSKVIVIAVVVVLQSASFVLCFFLAFLASLTFVVSFLAFGVSFLAFGVSFLAYGVSFLFFLPLVRRKLRVNQSPHPFHVIPQSLLPIKIRIPQRHLRWQVPPLRL
jgi:hypothetical protein